jgi:hypothetical protein
MASLIHELDERSRLYIAKVGTDRESNIKAQHIQDVSAPISLSSISESKKAHL